MIRKIENDCPETCTVTWEISNKCNYSCWYCPAHLHSGSTSWPDLEKSLLFFDKLSRINDNVVVTITGGEPTLWPKLTEFLEKTPDNVFTEIVTNGSRTISWWKRVKKSLDRVVLSFHPNTADIDHFLSVATLLQEDQDIDVFTMLLYDSSQELKLNDVSVRLRENNIDYQYKPIYPDFGPIMLNYDDVQRSRILDDYYVSTKKRKKQLKPSSHIIVDGEKTTIKHLLINQLNNFQGFSCLAGSKRFHISYEGTVYVGSCLAMSLGRLGDSIVLNEPIICPKNSCRCFDDVKVKKWKTI